MARPDARSSAWNWDIKVGNTNANWAISRVAFPRVALADEGDATRALYPQASGIVVRNPVKSALSYGGPYPNGWTTMPLMAVYHETKTRHGLYFAMHDPLGADKNVLLRANDNGALELSYDQTAPNIDKPATDFKLSGQAHWQLLRGDWFDAGQIYKAWAQKNASWWPKVGREGREDTPLWMRKLGGWTTSFSSGKAAEVSPDVLALQKSWGIPIGFHWYNWHAIPFDNGYPHYFPPKDGADFSVAVKNLQSQNVHVMPYINGRIWDTRDKGVEDFEFTSRALPAATKEEKDGKLVPVTETYDSKESDGSTVVLAAMCPSTQLWQNEIKNIVTRLTKDEGTDAVYIDQVAAAAPVMCLDPAHSHPAGGGSWWVQDYNAMLAKVRAALPPGRMLTTECNAEPYIKSFDGYLTWHWQFDGQVPLFPEIYGGAIQMFGRAYGAGATSDIAMRMKSAQQLTWGEQIGWLAPDLALKATEAPFLRRTVRTREQLARFFYAGQMARPPHLGGTIPTITADWEWQGVAIVTTDAAMSGLWKIPAERKAALILSNVSEKPIEITLDTKQLDLGNAAANLQLAPLQLDDVTTPNLKNGSNTLTLPPRAIYAWNVTW